MIYRIAIYRNDNGKMVFDHYAKENELIMLKVSADGKVFKIIETKSSQRPDKMVIDWDVVSKGVYLILDWYDVSDTHKIEFGYKLYDKEVYSGDIIETIYHEVYEIGTMPVFFMNLHEMGLRKNEYKVIGNIHQNPELLEVKE